MTISLEAADALESAIDRKIENAAPKRTRAAATVTRRDSDGTVYVRLEGADTETPVSGTAAAVKPGDVVGVTVDNGRLTIDGNYSAPATDDTAARAAQRTADSALQSADVAASAASDAVSSAAVAAEAAAEAQDGLKSIVQGATTVEKAVSVMQTALEAVVDYDPQEDTVTEYFWHDANGAHVLGDESGYRNDIDSSGMTIVELSSEEEVAHFGASGTLIGKASSGNYIELDSDSIDMYHESSALVHFGYGEGNAEDGTDYAPYYTLGSRKVADQDYSAGPYEVGDQVRYEGVEYVCTEKITQPEAFNPNHWHLLNGCNSVAVGEEVTADGWASNAEGNWTHANGSLSHAEGQNTYSSGFASHAENGSSGGVPTMATGTDSHAEGGGTVASGIRAHAQGYRSVASGNNSHAEGSSTVASATGAHSQGQGTIAASTNQTAIGKHNIADSNGDYAVIVGNGTADNARSNALTVDWSGNVGIAGDVRDLSGVQKYMAAFRSDTPGADLNDMAYGETWFGNNFTNAPAGITGYMQVTRISAVQIATNWRSGDVPRVYSRTYVNSAWSGWVRLDNDDIGARHADDQSSNVSVANTTWVAIASVELEAGVWVLNGNVTFASNATGRRYACIHSASPTTAAQRQCETNANATSGAQTVLNLAGSKTPTATTTYTLYAYQTSGSTLNCTGYLAATRIK